LLKSPGLIQEPADDGSQIRTSRQQMRSAQSSVKLCDDSTSGIKLYFLGYPGRIKIGISRQVMRRLQEIANQMDQPPVLLGAVNGSRGFEKYLHKRLAKHRLHSEWFSDCEEVRDTMARVLNGDRFSYKPKPNSAGHVQIKQREQTPEEWLAMLNRVAALIYPGDPVALMADDFELPRQTVSDYLTGKEPIPVVVAAAFAARVAFYAMSDLRGR
jgi:hypothetical protein